jgi:hypothetical protein
MLLVASFCAILTFLIFCIHFLCPLETYLLVEVKRLSIHVYEIAKFQIANITCTYVGDKLPKFPPAEKTSYSA